MPPLAGNMSSVRAMVLVAICVGTAVAAARTPPAVKESVGRARLSDRPAATARVTPAQPPAEAPRRRDGALRPAQYTAPELPESPTAADGSLPAATPEAESMLRSLLATNTTPIDLFSAFRLAGIQNSDLLVARQRVIEATALRQLAAAQFLPTLNFGTSVDSHRGNLQQSSGNILSVRRDSLFVGAGANAIAAGTVNIPGVMWNLNLSETIYAYLASRREVDRTAADSRTVEQDVLLGVALGYTDLVRSAGLRNVLAQTRDDAAELARLTAAYASAGEGSQADADRAATEFSRRDAEVIQAEGTILTASTNLCRLLHLDPSSRLRPAETFILPQSVVPEPIPLAELVAIGVLNRPELTARRAAIAQAMMNFDGAKILPFSPTVFIGFSAGDFGGGSDIASQPDGSAFFARGQSRFGNFAARQDLDAMAYWTLRNLGVGNKALIDATRSRLQSADLERLVTLDLVRSQVAAAHARTHARYARIETCELGIRAGTEAFSEDMERIRGREGRPIEAVDSLRLLARSRVEYLDAILDYNEAQFQLYVALGKPPIDVLIRPAEELAPPLPAPPLPIPPAARAPPGSRGRSP